MPGTNKQTIIRNSGGGSTNDKGYFANPTALNTAYPTGSDGWYAVVGSTDTVWIWDSGTTAWVDSGGSSTGTNLGYTASATNGIVTSDTGTDATIQLGNGTNAGLSLNDYTTAEKSKLAGIEAGADVTDATNVNSAGAVMNSDYTPDHSVLVQQSGTGSPSIVSLGTGEILGRKTGGGSDIEGLDATEAKTILALENVNNTSDLNKPISTATQTALDGKANTSHTHTLSQVTDVTMTVANLNSLDDGVNSTLHFHNTDRDRTNHTGTQAISTVTGLQTALDGKVDENAVITGATKTKITYDAKGLVTAGADATTADLADFNSATRAQTEAELVAGANITITPSGTGASRQLTIASTGGGGGLSDGDYGDVSVSGGGLVMTVDEPALRKSETSVNNSPLFTVINKFDTLQTNFYGTGTVALNTTIEAEGTGCMELTLATGGNCGPRLTLASATNFLKKAFTIKAQADNWSNISSAEIIFGNDASFTNAWLWQWKGGTNPKLVSPGNYNGEWVERVFNPGDCAVFAGSPNWSAVTHILIRGKASSGTPKLYVEDFKYFANTQKPFVAVTFDDGLLTQFTNGKAKLDQHDIKGTFYVIHNELTPGTNMETSHHDTLSTQGHDISGHGGTNLTSLSEAARIADLRAMKKYLLPYRGANNYALPNGASNNAVLKNVRNYFNSIANIDWLSNTPEYSPAYLINRFSPDSGTSTGTIQAWIDNAITYGGCIVITFHGIVASGATGAQVNQSTYDAIMDYIGTKKQAGQIDTGTLTDYYARPLIPDALVTRVIHGATAGTARPPVSYVEWVGSVSPTNSIDGDTWLETP